MPEMSRLAGVSVLQAKQPVNLSAGQQSLDGCGSVVHFASPQAVSGVPRGYVLMFIALLRKRNIFLYMSPTLSFAKSGSRLYGSNPRMNPLAKLVADRLETLKAQGITQTDVATVAKQASWQGFLSQVAKGLKAFPEDEIDRWAEGLRYEQGTPERAEFVEQAKLAVYLLSPGDLVRPPEQAYGLNYWRELLDLRARTVAAEKEALRAGNDLKQARAEIANLIAKADQREVVIGALSVQIAELKANLPRPKR